MMRQVLLVAFLFTVCESAVLMRFINTVPFAKTTESVEATAVLPKSRLVSAVPTAAITQVAQQSVDRIGLHYFTKTSNGVINSPTVVWTQILEESEQTGQTAPYAWQFAMPALRAYHKARADAATAEAVTVDKPCSPILDADNQATAVNQMDFLEHTRLKADGVGLYLSFAPGTYTVEAFLASGASAAGVTPATTTATSTAKPLTTSTSTLTFVDNMVYTLIAYGPATNVKLSLLTESTQMTTFGMASLRWFHGIQSQSANAIDVYNGSGFGAETKIASSIAFGGVSNYIDVTPGTIKEFPIAQAAAATGTITPVASSDPVRHDIRAGMRATMICAITDTTASQVFCRAIPSRIVAYVRLVHDAAGQSSLVQGQFGPQQIALTRLSLYAQYEFPRPEELVEGSQVGGSTFYTGHPATTEGPYPVVVNVAPNSVSGYGEVFVPLFIMDFAVRFVITADFGTERTTDAAQAGFEVGSNTNFDSQTWFLFSPVFKRVHFQVNTDGFSTLAGIATANTAGTIAGDPFPFVGAAQKGVSQAPLPLPFTGVATNTHNLATSVSLDNYVEAGQSYSFIVTATAGSTDGYQWQKSSVLSFFFRLDASVARTSTGVAAGKGVLTLVPFNNQVFQAASSFTLQLTGTNTVPTTTNLATIGVATARMLVATNKVALVEDSNTALTPGSYTWSYILANTPPVANAICQNNIPGPGTLTINAGDQVDLFVLNTYGCILRSSDATRLAVTIVTRKSAVASGHSPMSPAATPAASTTTRAVRSYLSIPFYSAAAHSASSSIFALLAALIALVCLAL